MTIYRTNALQVAEPQFSFVEKMFVSNKLHHRFVGHSILIGKELGRWAAIVGIIGGLVAALAGAVWLVGMAVEYVYFLLIHRHYSQGQVIGMMGGALLVIFVVTLGIKTTLEWIKENNKYMKECIAAKLNKHQEENNGSEAS